MRSINTLLCLFVTLTVVAQNAVTEKYYRQLRYNHVSPHIPYMGIHEISSAEAKKTAHYIFKYNDTKQLIEIINHDYSFHEDHFLNTIGAYKTIFEYENKMQTCIYFDKIGNRTVNDRDVYKEVFHYDKNGFKYALHFFDLKNEPMESNCKVTRYYWEKNKKLVIEKRYNLNDSLVNIAPYFDFGVTGILYDNNNFPNETFNLDGNLMVKENSSGIASYRDTYDKNGNHIEFSYHNAKGELINNSSDFAVGKKEYDEKGNLITLNVYDNTNKSIAKIKFPSRDNINLAAPVTQKDSLEIKNISLGYLIALQELKPKLMKKVFHPDLAKRSFGFNSENKNEIIHETTYKQMIEFAKSWNKSGTRFPPKPNNKAIILDIYNQIANVKLISDNWVEYLHLVKTNNEWNIINLLWQNKDISDYENYKQ
ncbi:nuclear transport factor 2 family protein [Aquimarina megaterium]|uniref:nuclear transport factor 2 family protein n=1 Tax=Aquimarina megaterium TaxID=1443666 RepID=UPI000941D459|nr:nuclear transport factor 2 family protein [Aquimarina megaterium]